MGNPFTRLPSSDVTASAAKCGSELRGRVTNRASAQAHNPAPTKKAGKAVPRALLSQFYVAKAP